MMEKGNPSKFYRVIRIQFASYKEIKHLCHKNRNNQIRASLEVEILKVSKIICQQGPEFAGRLTKSIP